MHTLAYQGRRCGFESDSAHRALAAATFIVIEPAGNLISFSGDKIKCDCGGVELQSSLDRHVKRT